MAPNVADVVSDAAAVRSTRCWTVSRARRRRRRLSAPQVIRRRNCSRGSRNRAPVWDWAPA